MSGNINLKDSKPVDGTEERLRKENDALEKKIQDEFGGSGVTGHQGLPETMRNEFLNYVYAMEQQFREQKEVVIYKIIGEPKYPRHFELSDEDLIVELDKVLDLLYQHQIEICSLYDVPAREFYRFITEELFLEETQVINIEGFFTNYIYEEFHPNDTEDLKADMVRFVNEVINARLNPEYNLLDKVVERSDGTIIDREQLCKSLSEHFSNFSSCHLADLKTDEVVVNGNEASVNLSLSYKVIDGNNTMQIFEGTGNMAFSREPDQYWRIKKIDIPGFTF